jgi:dipeptidyl aminopeptidase/acylaminoacyl peptidase
MRVEDFSAVSKNGFGRNTDIATFDWVNDDRLLLSPSRNFFGIDFNQPTGEIFGIDADGGDFEILFGYQAGQRTSGRIVGREAILAAGEVIDLYPEDPDLVVIQSIGYGLDGEFNESWLMNVNTGRLRDLERSPVRNGRFVTDHNHDIRYVMGGNSENVTETYMLKAGKWELLSTDADIENWVAPILPWGKDGKMLVRDFSTNRTFGLSVWDPETGQKEDLIHHPDVDMGAMYTDNDRTLWAVTYVDHFPDYYYPDPEHPLAVIHQRLRQTFPSLNVQILDETNDLNKILVFVSSPQRPGDYLLMDTGNFNFLLRLAKYPDFPLESLSRMDPVLLTARDGTELRGYLTMPTGTGEKNLPMVVMPHGGPFDVFDSWVYNYEAQLLASKGYAVFQLNFRGSGGRGRSFVEAGYGEWGGKMQDDITDSVIWAINDGVADPERVCIYGTSYGGYAALMGAAKNPDMFQCAIGLSGVYDLNLLFEKGDIADATRGQVFLEEVLGNDESLLSERSPIHNAGKISADIMLVHGRRDVRAPFEHAVRMRDALEKAGKEVTWVVETRETHGILSEENRVEVYEQILGFLEKNIGR